MGRIALVAGATGLVGGLLLRRLANGTDYAEVRVIGRRPPAPRYAQVGAAIESSQGRPPHEHGKFRFIASDYSDLAAHAASLAVDDVYCCLGTTLRIAGSREAFERVDYHMVVDLARATQKAGAKKFLVVSAVGASERSAAFYSRVKGRMEAAVSALPFEAVHILRPSLILGDRQQRRPAEALAQRVAPLLAPLFVGPLKKYRAIDADDIAEAMLTLARGPLTGAQVHHLPL